MFAMPGLRTFSLSARGRGSVSCDADGVYVGDVSLLTRSGGSGANRRWVIRPISELNNELSALYRLPVDAARKTNALQLIATALDHGDLAMAAIATVQMQFTDPPPLAKGIETCEEIGRRAAELGRSGLLKFWDPAEHPRTGTPPNPGWFAPVNGDEPETAMVLPAAMRPSRPGFSPWDFRPDIVEGGGGGGVPRGQLELSFPRFWSRPTIIEVPAKPPSPLSTLSVPLSHRQRFHCRRNRRNSQRLFLRERRQVSFNPEILFKNCKVGTMHLPH